MVEFIEEGHIYLVDGVIVPSVTQILHKVFPEKYEGIPKEVLNAKANYGTDVHKYIEIINKKKLKRPLAYIKKYCNPDMYQEESIRQYLEILKEYNIEI